MTVSTSTSFNLTATQIVNAALRKLGVLSEGQSANSTQLSNGYEALNSMLKLFMAKGMPLWEIVEYNMSLSATRTYTFGDGQTNNIPAPLKVNQIILVDTSANTGIPLNVRSHYDYNLLTNTSSSGTPTTYWYEPLNQTGVLHLWPTPDDYSITNRVAKIVYQAPFKDVSSGSNTLDFPQWWLDAIIYGLAWRLAPEYTIPLSDQSVRAKEADYFLNEALSFGTEDGSLSFQPDWTTMGMR